MWIRPDALLNMAGLKKVREGFKAINPLFFRRLLLILILLCPRTKNLFYKMPSWPHAQGMECFKLEVF
ncbi:MAG: hypothetical protein EBS72_02595 [Rhizobiales bacterium]|nr:hypothetical protein [Hyphomicrobiales bacterium]